MPLLEICVEDARGVAAAVEGGAGRIELCAALDVGGLTPAASLIRHAAAAPIPVHLLARPRAGGFVYDAAEQALVADDIRAAADAGLAGVVIGASLAADRRLDAPCLSRWIDHARALGSGRGAALSLTLHRAFDLVPDRDAALETAVALGFDRILTSGGAVRAPDALPALTRLVARAAGRIGILPGSGITPRTLPAILATGATEAHASARCTAAEGDAVLTRFGFEPERRSVTDAATVRRMAEMMVAA